MTDKDRLEARHACKDMLDWIGDRTIEQAWVECKRGDWMCWLLGRIALNDPRCRLAAADFAERVWHLITDEPTKLAAAWAIDAVRRGDKDEMQAAADAADAAYAAAYAATFAYAAYAAAYAAYAATFAYAAYAAAYAVAATFAASDAFAASVERAAQADILREYFPASEIAALFNRR